MLRNSPLCGQTKSHVFTIVGFAGQQVSPSLLWISLQPILPYFCYFPNFCTEKKSKISKTPWKLLSMSCGLTSPWLNNSIKLCNFHKFPLLREGAFSSLCYLLMGESPEQPPTLYFKFLLKALNRWKHFWFSENLWDPYGFLKSWVGYKVTVILAGSGIQKQQITVLWKRFCEVT